MHAFLHASPTCFTLVPGLYMEPGCEAPHITVHETTDSQFLGECQSFLAATPQGGWQRSLNMHMLWIKIAQEKTFIMRTFAKTILYFLDLSACKWCDGCSNCHKLHAVLSARTSPTNQKHNVSGPFSAL